MPPRVVTVSPDGGVTNTSVTYADASKVIPTAGGPKVVSDFVVGDSVCVISGSKYVEIMSIP